MQVCRGYGDPHGDPHGDSHGDSHGFKYGVGMGMIFHPTDPMGIFNQPEIGLTR